jgi:hypothetical protein
MNEEFLNDAMVLVRHLNTSDENIDSEQMKVVVKFWV